MGDLMHQINAAEYDELLLIKRSYYSPEFSMARNIVDSYKKARAKHAPMRGPHEGYAILLEEVDELWDEVKAWRPDNFDNTALKKEAMHVAAMSLAFLLEACEYKR